MGRKSKVLVKQLETAKMTAGKKILGCSSTTKNTTLRAELGVYPLRINRDVRKLNRHDNIPGKEHAEKEVASHS